MRTNITIDDHLIEEAMQASGLKTKREVVELGLKTLIQLNRQATIKEYRGKLTWIGDLEQMRSESLSDHFLSSDQ